MALGAGQAGRDTTFHQVVLPKRLGNVVLKAYQDFPLGGHVGFAKLYEHLLRQYSWDGMYTDVQDYARACFTWNRRKTPDRQRKSEWVKRTTVWKPFRRISMDFSPLGRRRRAATRASCFVWTT